VVKTETEGRVRIGLLDGSVLNVASQSSLEIARHDPAAQQTELELNYGRIRANVVHISQSQGKFTVRTPVAVAGVLGTRFDVQTTADASEVLCIEDQVRVRNADDKVPGEVTLHAGEFTRVLRGAAPTPPAPASAAQLADSFSQSMIVPRALSWSRAELSWPLAGCGGTAVLNVRAWTGQVQKDITVEESVDPELVSGQLILDGTPVEVEGGRAVLSSAPGSKVPEGNFTPYGSAAPIPTTIFAPESYAGGLAPGPGWHAPRAVFISSIFYVSGPMGSGRQPEFTLSGSPASLAWSGTCGAGFLAPKLRGGAYKTALYVDGRLAANGELNLVNIIYSGPTPPAVLRGQTSRFAVQYSGLAGLGALSQGRPVIVSTMVNTTPVVMGELQTQTAGAKASGETITFMVRAQNIDPSGSARLEGSGRSRNKGVFVLRGENRLDEALAAPRTPMTPAAR
jgi:FecR protein